MSGSNVGKTVPANWWVEGLHREWALLDAIGNALRQIETGGDVLGDVHNTLRTVIESRPEVTE